MPAFKPRGSARKIKLSKNLKPFVSRVNRAGAVQLAFTEEIGKPVGGCVSGKLKGRTRISGVEVHTAAYDCSRQAVGKTLHVESYRAMLKARARVPGIPAPVRGYEYLEVV